MRGKDQEDGGKGLQTGEKKGKVTQMWTEKVKMK